ncbi:MAG: hypothetical protein V7L31_10335 [Nostoc sp.]|uniref:hypothetical protein n=1 Tax=Nostoc sp. TaxID=1180 RepID=UPI002FEF5D76
MTLAMRREFQFPADKRFRVKLTPMSHMSALIMQVECETAYNLSVSLIWNGWFISAVLY